MERIKNMELYTPLKILEGDVENLGKKQEKAYDGGGVYREGTLDINVSIIRVHVLRIIQLSIYN